MFNHDFLWGGSLSSMQSEGAWNEDGKGLTTYDIKKLRNILQIGKMPLIFIIIIKMI